MVILRRMGSKCSVLVLAWLLAPVPLGCSDLAEDCILLGCRDFIEIEFRDTNGVSVNTYEGSVLVDDPNFDCTFKCVEGAKPPDFRGNGEWWCTSEGLHVMLNKAEEDMAMEISVQSESGAYSGPLVPYFESYDARGCAVCQRAAVEVVLE